MAHELKDRLQRVKNERVGQEVHAAFPVDAMRFTGAKDEATGLSFTVMEIEVTQNGQPHRMAFVLTRDLAHAAVEGIANVLQQFEGQQ